MIKNILHIMAKITKGLTTDNNPPCSLMVAGSWLSKLLTEAEIDKVLSLGEEKGNPLIVKAFVNSGKYGTTTDGQSVYLLDVN